MSMSVSKVSRIMNNPSELECMTNIPKTEWDKHSIKLSEKVKQHNMVFEYARNIERTNPRGRLFDIEV